MIPKSPWKPVDLMKKPEELKAHDVVKALQYRHRDDVCTTELGLGRWGRRRVDLWAMRRSHAHPGVFGYEIKVSRRDWERDEKFLEYAECCNELYVACPSSLIQPGEVPEDVGVVWVSGSGKCMCKKKAKFVDRDLTEAYRRVLMRYEDPIQRLFDDERRYEQYIAQKQVLSRLNPKLKRALENEMTAAQGKINELEQQQGRANHAVAVLQHLGVPEEVFSEENTNSYVRGFNSWDMRAVEKKLIASVMPELSELLEFLPVLRSMRRQLSDAPRLYEALSKADDAMDELQKKLKPKDN